jgi:two-component system response regulator
LTKACIPCPVNIVTDGQEAIDYLSHPDKNQFPTPRFILTDLKMPRVNGFELLRWHRESESRAVPIVVLTSSGHREDVRAAYSNGASGYFVKPRVFDQTIDLWKSVCAYWEKSEHP